MKFGKLTAIKMVGRTKHYQVLWLCRCDCGNEIVVTGTNLRSGASKSCGCYRIKHGLTGSKIYAAYKHMKDRCLNPSSQCYKDYGGRGISVCEEWLGKDGFEKFEKWSSNHGYKEGLSLDRIDNDKGYSPENCRWTTQKVQSRNTRRNRYIELDGVKKSASEWCEDFNICTHTFYYRMRVLGMNEIEALTLPKASVRKHKYKVNELVTKGL